MSNKDLARVVNRYVKGRDKLTKAEWVANIKPLMKNVQNTINQQILSVDATQWDIFNLKRILESINILIDEFESRFFASLSSAQSVAADLGTNAKILEAGSVGLSTDVLLGQNLISTITPMTEILLNFFTQDMKKIIAGSVTNSIISRKTTGEAIKDLTGKFGIDSAHIDRLKTKKELLKNAFKTGEITKTEYLKKIKPINRKLQSGSMMSYARAEGIVRTEMLTASSMAQSQTEIEIGKLDPDARKMWLWSHKPTGRIDHQQVEAQTTQEPIKTDALYQVGGEAAMFPRSPELSAKQRVNCGCTSVLINVNDKEGLSEIGSIISGL